jgi:hypothetical protein
MKRPRASADQMCQIPLGLCQCRGENQEGFHSCSVLVAKMSTQYEELRDAEKSQKITTIEGHADVVGTSGEADRV